MRELLELEQKKRRLATVCITVAMLFLVLCDAAIAGQTSAAPTAPLPGRELADEDGRRIRVPREVNRIVSLAPNLTEIVFSLGDGNHLVGDTDFCDYPPEALQKPHVGGPVNPNLEEVVALKPDLVVATSINRRET